MVKGEFSGFTGKVFIGFICSYGFEGMLGSLVYVIFCVWSLRLVSGVVFRS